MGNSYFCKYNQYFQEMKMKPCHSVLVFAALVVSAIASSVSSFNRMQNDIVSDMDQALAITLHERQDLYLTPDTIQDYRSHLKLEYLRESSLLCYVVEDNKRGKHLQANTKQQLTSKTMTLNSQAIKGYANCSFADVFGMSDQRMPFCLTFAAMLWAVGMLLCHRKRIEENRMPLVATTLAPKDINENALDPNVTGTLAYSSVEDRFYNRVNQQAVRFTPLQHKLMRMFFDNKLHQLSKQDICSTLWPKKPDASETLYTLIRRIKPIVESCGLIIESERGRNYTLKERKTK
mgnify:CR=1 FL=1